MFQLIPYQVFKNAGLGELIEIQSKTERNNICFRKESAGIVYSDFFAYNNDFYPNKNSARKSCR